MANRRREQFVPQRWAPRVILDPAIFSPSSSRSLTPARAARRARLNVIVYYRVILRAPAGADAAMSVLYQSKTIFSRVRTLENRWKISEQLLKTIINPFIWNTMVEDAHSARNNTHTHGAHTCTHIKSFNSDIIC